MDLTRRKLFKMVGCYSLGKIIFPMINISAIDSMNNIIQRTIPSTGDKLPGVGLGTWLQFDVGSSEEERKPLVDVLKQMNRNGGMLIDSSPMYGAAEEVIGDLTLSSGIANKYFYATKVWTSGEERGIRQIEESMRRMKRETIDLMQVHNLVDVHTHLKTLKRLKAEGKIRYIGLTHYTIPMHFELERFVKNKEVDFVQFNYSIRVRNAEKSLLKAAQDNGVAVIINQPFETGNVFSLVRGKSLPDWAAEYGIQNWPEFFLKYILSNPAVTCVIPGTSDPAHVVENIKAGYGLLPDENGRKRMVEFISKL